MVKCSICGKEGHTRANKSFHPRAKPLSGRSPLRRVKSPRKSPRRQVKKSPKLERCIMKVKEKQSRWCEQNKFPAGKVDPKTGKICYNPWAVCRSVIKE